ncbi:hypothetical protein HID58_046072 [Brassica napus]|uniref:Uncharacterized protein n=1 Tax=Brassica napus TaxID=3708 RepID=A0ABQ8AVI3_BRANA|nr:hypothetical protein HID58_046072 [Brassica napus]
MVEMVKTKFTRNGREVMIFGAMRNFDYGSDEAVQESKKGGERDASVSLSSPERSRIRISMLASTEASKASKTRRGTSYGSPASSPEKTTRRGTSYGGSHVSPRQSKKQKVNSEKSLGDDGDDREEFLQIVVNKEKEFGDIGDDGREDENGIAGIEEVGITFWRVTSSIITSSILTNSILTSSSITMGSSSIFTRSILTSSTITMGSSPILTSSTITDNSVGKFFDHTRIAPGYHEFPSYSQMNPHNPNSSCDTRRRKGENRDS